MVNGSRSVSSHQRRLLRQRPQRMRHEPTATELLDMPPSGAFGRRLPPSRPRPSGCGRRGKERRSPGLCSGLSFRARSC